MEMTKTPSAISRLCFLVLITACGTGGSAANEGPYDVILKNGSVVSLTISNGPPPCCTVPDLTGMTLEDAQRALQAANLTMGSKSLQLLTSGKADTVVDQSPGVGAHLRPGQPVNLVIGVFSLGGGGGGKGKHGHD